MVEKLQAYYSELQPYIIDSPARINELINMDKDIILFLDYHKKNLLYFLNEELVHGT